ncbi:hypothetical protein ACFX2I_043922 [Malus domestica]
MPYPGLSFVPVIHYTSTTHGDAYHPDFSNPNGEYHLHQQVSNFTSAHSQQTTLVNQLLECIEMQCATDEVSRSRTKVEEHDLFQRCPEKNSLNLPRTMRLGSVHSRLGLRGNIFS